DREWVSFCEKFLKQPELTRALGFADNMERLSHRAQLDEILERRFSELSCHEAMQELEAAGLAYGRLNEVADVSKHPHGRRVEIGTPEGSVETIAPAAIFNYEQPSLRPVPALGANSEAVRKEVLGLLRDRAASA
ncbi:CoA transferase, partial [Mesorhizobium sp. VK24D]